jgi:hypothetical protein
VIFLGPSLERAAARELLPDAEFRRPIRRGDLREFVNDPPAAIGIVDGEFFQSLAVSPKEILPLLEAGVRVYGSSSMGALRAVELAHYGMTGVGRIYELFRSGRLCADDEVALVFHPETLRPLSEPLVNLRLALSAAHRAGLISLAELIGLTRRMKRLYFPERTRECLLAEAPLVLRAWWPSAPDAKAQDARQLLRACGALDKSGGVRRPIVPLKLEAH